MTNNLFPDIIIASPKPYFLFHNTVCCQIALYLRIARIFELAYGR